MRPYRWQDPAPEAVRAIRSRRDHRELAAMFPLPQPETIALPVRDMSEPKRLSMTWAGAEYVEKAGVSCSGCAFIGIDCDPVNKEAARVFGGDCQGRNVIYIRKA